MSHIRCTQYYRYMYRSGTAAGWGYLGKKDEKNHGLAVKNAYRALRDYHFWRDKYLFVPYKAFARSQLALKITPKIRHV